MLPDGKDVKDGAATEEESSPSKETESKETKEKEVSEESEETSSKTLKEKESSEESSEEEAESEESEEESEEGEETDETNGQKPSKAVPYSRFKEMQQSLRDTQAELQRLKEQTAESNKPRKLEDLSVDELKTLRAHYRKSENSEMVEHIEELMIDKRAEQVADRKLGALRFDQVRVQTWEVVVDEYKKLNDKAFDLENQDSELYRRTAKLVSGDGRFNKEPEGHAIAARLVAEQMLRERLAKTKSTERVLKKKVAKSATKESLERGGRASQAGSESLGKLLKAAEGSGSPFSPEWRRYLTALDKAKKG